MASIPSETKTVGITGHRSVDFNLTGAEWVQTEMGRVLDTLRAEHAASTVLSGLASGTELWGANVALARGYAVEAYLPFVDEPARLRWNSATQGLHQRILAKCVDTKVFTTLPEPGDRELTSNTMLDGYDLRNEALVAFSDIMLVCWNGRTTGSTSDALRKAVLTDTPVILLALRSLKVIAVSREALAERLEVTLPVAA